jgi:hypothetical protein
MYTYIYAPVLHVYACALSNTSHFQSLVVCTVVCVIYKCALPVTAVSDSSMSKSAMIGVGPYFSLLN